MILCVHLLEAPVDPCVPDPCNKNGATGEVCAAGTCNCGNAPCDAPNVCNAGVCGMYLKLNGTNNLVNTKLYLYLGYV